MKLGDYLVTAFLLFMLASCTVQKRYIHSASPPLSPTFSGKGEAFVSGFIHLNGDRDNTSSGSGFSGQAGYAFANQFAIAGSYSTIKHESNYQNVSPFDTSNVTYNQNNLTVAINHFNTGKQKSAGLSLLLGASFGKLNITDDGRLNNANYNRFLSVNNFSVFLQPSLVTNMDEILKLSFIPKLSYLNFGDASTNYTDAEKKSFRLDKISSGLLSEMGMKMSIGPEKIPFAFDVQFNYILLHPYSTNMRRANYSFGITYNIRSAKAAR